MLTALLSVAALAAAISLGFLRRVNIGLVSIPFAFLVGRLMLGLPAARIVTGWPLNLFFMLLGITLLFSIAGINGTLSQITRKTIAATRGRTRLIPPAFFMMCGALAAIGPGNIAICALVLPIAMAVAEEQRIPPLLMAAMVIAGANAGGLSPIAPTGIIGITLARELGLEIGRNVFIKQIIGQTILAATVYCLLRGYRLPDGPGRPEGGAPFSRAQKTTVAVFLLVVTAIVLGRWDLGLTAFTGAVILLFLRAADEKEALAAVPWSTLILVSGVGMLVRTVESAGGIEMMSRALIGIMNARTAGPIMAVIGGMLSIVSSASGVVMPTLIPTVPTLAQGIGGDPARIISAIIMGAHVVTNSPLSTLGALAIASAGRNVDRQALFKNLFVLALAGLAYAALIVYLGIV